MSATTPHPLTTARQQFAWAAETLERYRAELQARGEVDAALKLERALDYCDEVVRILDGLIEATSKGKEANG